MTYSNADQRYDYAAKPSSEWQSFPTTKKLGIQAIATTAPDLPPKPGVHATFARDYEYKRTRKRWPERPDDFFIKPRAIAHEIWHVVHQHLTKSSAEKAARDVLRLLGRPVGTATYRILDCCGAGW